eukprot:gene5529-6706_t
MFSRAGRNLFCSLAPFNAYPQAFQTQAPRYFTAAVSSISSQVDGIPVKIFNENGSKRVVVTKDLPGKRWLDVLVNADCRVEVCTHPDAILDVAKVKTLISTRCDGVIGQLTEDWSEELFGALKSAGGTAFSTYAAANAHGLPVGNTPGVLTETTAEIAAALTLAAARRVAEVALVTHLRANPEFRCGLDVYEDEPLMKPGLAECANAVILPHIASASLWTRYKTTSPVNPSPKPSKRRSALLSSLCWK